MRGAQRERFGQFSHVDAVAPFERGFADLMLLDVVLATKADGPSIGRLERRSAVGVAVHMRAFDRPPQAAGNAAMMPPDPGAMRRAFAAGARPALALKPSRELQSRH